MSRASVPPAQCGARSEVRAMSDPTSRSSGLARPRPRPRQPRSAIPASSFANEIRQGEERVDAVLHELRRTRHPSIRFDPKTLRATLRSVLVALRPDADHDPVRSRECRDRVSEPQILRRVRERAASPPDRSSSVVPTGSCDEIEDRGLRVGRGDDCPGPVHHESTSARSSASTGVSYAIQTSSARSSCLLPTGRWRSRAGREPATDELGEARLVDGEAAIPPVP